MREFPLDGRKDIFALLREVERRSPDLARLGTLGDNAAKRLTLQQRADLAFASREVAQVRQQDHHLHITLRHFGFFAPYGPLPVAITEHARNEAIGHNSAAFSDFLAMFSQRPTLMWFRAWNQLQPMSGCDRDGEGNRFQSRLKQVAGISEEAPGNAAHHRLRQNWPAAWLPGRASLRDLQQMLNHFFELPLRFYSAEGLWITPREAVPQHRMGRLGKTRLGKRFFDAQHTLRIEIGPLSYPVWQSWQRGEQKLLLLAAMCQMFVRHQLHICIDLLLKTSSLQARRGPHKLGRDSWLKPRDAIVRQRVWQTPI